MHAGTIQNRAPYVACRFCTGGGAIAAPAVEFAAFHAAKRTLRQQDGAFIA